MVTDYVLDGRYQLDYRIASGGMGEVWAGTDLRLNRAVAVKMLSAQHSGDEQFRARFRAEARYAASLSHPGITSVFTYGENSPLGGPYLIMELVNGEPLSAILERVGRLSAYNTMDVVAQAARALDIAHAAGIVHRDIKPGNLLIMGDGTTKITDFGIAKAREWGDPQLTATGIVMGTAMYVSPEQATGSEVTGSSDIYSLGVVAYECLAGEPPFIAEQPLAIAIMHKHDPVPPLPDDVPRQVNDLVMSMLAKSPEGRPESALHVADRADVIMHALRRGSGGLLITATSELAQVPEFPTGTQAVQEEEPFPARTVSSPFTRRRMLAGGAGVAVCGVAAAAIVVALSGNSQPNTPGHFVGTSQSVTHGATPASATVGSTPAGIGATTTNVGTVSQSQSASQSASPTATSSTTSAPITKASGTPTPSHTQPTPSSGPSTSLPPPPPPPPTSDTPPPSSGDPSGTGNPTAPAGDDTGGS
ncbi:MAG TPA: serine/threonine-protein kinase [Trebonia sp.]|jgi:serine/threonine-protein kinase|nr:serine/threonine-protein kinase [Trebonia sp.]